MLESRLEYLILKAQPTQSLNSDYFSQQIGITKKI